MSSSSLTCMWVYLQSRLRLLAYVSAEPPPPRKRRRITPRPPPPSLPFRIPSHRIPPRFRWKHATPFALNLTDLGHHGTQEHVGGLQTPPFRAAPRHLQPRRIVDGDFPLLPLRADLPGTTCSPHCRCTTGCRSVPFRVVLCRCEA